MQEYRSKDELIAEIEKRYTLFNSEFDDVSEEKAKILVTEVDRTPHQMLAYQIGWIGLLNSWETDEKVGKSVITPHPDFKWNNLGGLYQNFYNENDIYTLKECQDNLRAQLDILLEWISNLSDDELFLANQRNWTKTTANWPMWKWIHINTVAPFKSFRTKIRKWKKQI